MRHHRLIPVAFVVLTSCAFADSDFDAALALFEKKHFAAARMAFEKIVTTQPRNAEAWFYLGRAITRVQTDNDAYEQAVKWLAKAVELEPANPKYLGIYGGTSLSLASRTSSISAVIKGRDAMEKALTIDPGYNDARDGLYQFYIGAPWPFSSGAKAAAHLEEIRKRDPERAAALSALAKGNAKDFATAFKLCDEVLAKNPEHYLALYQYGRAAALSGQNLERGFRCLQQCLEIDPPAPSSPSHSSAWHRLGDIHAHRNNPAAARSAYEMALKVDVGNKLAAEALAKLK
jgi:tetratricopeptide (TPR) repeat protein